MNLTGIKEHSIIEPMQMASSESVWLLPSDQEAQTMGLTRPMVYHTT